MQPAAPRVHLVATLTTPPPASGLDPQPLVDVDWLEVRADLIDGGDDLDPERLRARFPGRLLYTFRSRDEGGGRESSPEIRRQRLKRAVERFDLIDLEAERDLNEELLQAVPPEKRVLSWHGRPGEPTGLEGLEAIFARMVRVPAALYKLVPSASRPGEELAPLRLLHHLDRRDVLAFSSGEVGAWTRLVAPRLGAPVVYGSLGEIAGAPGQPSIQRLCRDFGLPLQPPADRLFGILGNPVSHSLSPRLHNAAYRELGIPALYLPFHTEALGEFWLEVVESGVLEEIGLPLRGFSVTSPFKEAALAVAGAESPLVNLIGAANTLVWNQGVWEAEATDPDGVVLPLLDRGLRLEGVPAAVAGAGGAGRSAVAGLSRAGAKVVLFNRDEERGRSSASHLRVPFAPLAQLDPAGFDVLVNATSLGRAASDPLPFTIERLRPGSVVIDLVYLSDGPTRLLAEAERAGAIAVDGREVLVDQARGQFRMMTGQDLPLPLCRRLAGLPETP